MKFKRHTHTHRRFSFIRALVIMSQKFIGTTTKRSAQRYVTDIHWSSYRANLQHKQNRKSSVSSRFMHEMINHPRLTDFFFFAVVVAFFKPKKEKRKRFSGKTHFPRQQEKRAILFYLELRSNSRWQQIDSHKITHQAAAAVSKSSISTLILRSLTIYTCVRV